MEKEIDENKLFQEYAVEDLQRFIAMAGKDTTEKDLLSWQKGYIAGVNRAMGIKNG
jgi:hypothetical protein